MYSLAVIDGDIELDGRGKVIPTQGTNKVALEVDYALATSPYITAILSKAAGTLRTNEMLARGAILDTMKALTEKHARNPKLASNERIKSVENLSIVRLDNTSYEFYLDVYTEAGEKVRLSLERNYNG